MTTNNTTTKITGQATPNTTLNTTTSTTARPLVQFTSVTPSGPDLLAFEECYEPTLRETLEDKKTLLSVSDVKVWMVVDHKLAGESYGIFAPYLIDPDGLNLAIPDVSKCSANDLYVYSTTILPEYQGRGYGAVLKAYFLGLAKGKGFYKVVGHSTVHAMNMLNKNFGAKFGATHHNWCGTERTAEYYEIELT